MEEKVYFLGEILHLIFFSGCEIQMVNEESWHFILFRENWKERYLWWASFLVLIKSSFIHFNFSFSVPPPICHSDTRSQLKISSQPFQNNQPVNILLARNLNSHQLCCNNLEFGLLFVSECLWQLRTFLSGTKYNCCCSNISHLSPVFVPRPEVLLRPVRLEIIFYSVCIKMFPSHLTVVGPTFW